MITTGQIKTNREAGGGGALAEAVDVLKGGGWMGIFPEGTRSRRKEPRSSNREKQVSHVWERSSPMRR